MGLSGITTLDQCGSGNNEGNSFRVGILSFCCGAAGVFYSSWQQGGCTVMIASNKNTWVT